MRSVLWALIAGGVAAAVGWCFQAMPYNLREPGMPGDQAVLAHRTSAYSDITWMVAPSDHRMELRFFDRVEGGVCPVPSWADLRTLAGRDDRLRHLLGEPVASAEPPAATWPKGWAAPDPGTLTHTKYICLLPIGVLLNRRLMAAAGGDLRQAQARIVVVGLGSGVGIATLAHHLPQASITVVDIDREVIDMVRQHYPLLNWLTTQTAPNGEPRLRLVCKDARQYMRFDAADAAHAGKPTDLLVFDAYTSGSTIPPHLMTVEFFGECARALGEDGVFLANIIGSYRGEKRKVLGGAIRSLRHPGCGLGHVRSFPILQAYEYDGWADTETRNNIVVACRQPFIDADAWKRLQGFTPWSELAPIEAQCVTEVVYPSAFPAEVPNVWRGAVGGFLAWPIDAATRDLRLRFTAQPTPADRQHLQVWTTTDGEVMQKLRAAMKARSYDATSPAPTGWDDHDTKCFVLRRENWLQHAQETYRKTIAEARDDKNDGELLVGPIDDGKPRGRPTWLIAAAPLFTDARPNADIFNAE